MVSARGLTRRRFLGGGAGAVVAAFAGCSSQDEPPTGSPSGSSVFEALSFDGPDLVVTLVDDHAVSAVNLIGPDGGLFGQTDVPEGATVVRIELLDIKPEGAGFKHYTPGEHELVAVGEDESMPLRLEPQLEIIDVRQPQNKSEPSDSGRLLIEVENVGTAPTWVYDITNRDAPNRAANVDIGADSGVLLLEAEGLPESAIVPPDGSRKFEDLIFPLVFPTADEPRCGFQFNMTVIIGTPTLGPIEENIHVTATGEPLQSSLAGGYTCSEIAIQKGREVDTDD